MSRKIDGKGRKQHREACRPRLSLCMIARDNAKTLPAALETIRPWVDEMVVVDTGSHDETPRIADQLGARVFEFPWCDDFSAARNVSLRHAGGEWLFWMDSDDAIDPYNGEQLRSLAYSGHSPQTLGYVMQVHCPATGDASDGEATVVDHVKLFRNDPRLQFEFRIHEQVLPSIRRLGGNVQWTDIFVVHSGSDQSQAGRRGKYQRDMRILRLELEEKPDHPFVLFNLGMTLADNEEHPQAVAYLQRCLEVASPQDSHVRKAYALLVASLDQLGRTEEAFQVCQAGRSHYPRDCELWFREGLLRHKVGDLEDAVEAYYRALSTGQERHFSSLDRGIKGHKSRHNLAQIFTQQGRPDLAEVQWRMAIEQTPSYRPAWEALAQLLLEQQRLTTAEALSERMVRQPRLRPAGLALRGELAGARGEIDEARQQLDEALEEFPAEYAVHQARCRLAFEQLRSGNAEQALKELLQQFPDDAAALHNLGVVYLQRHDYGQAVDAFRRSLQVRPESTATQQHLDDALAQGELVASGGA